MGWPHRGPRAVLEVLNSVRSTGREVWTFYDMRMATSCLRPDSNVAWEHKNLLTSLAMMVGHDQLDVTNVASAEFLARRFVMLERAVRANPRAPNFAGLGRL
eukprot:11210620-Lingulodinium_polyedra.AAC.1